MTSRQSHHIQLAWQPDRSENDIPFSLDIDVEIPTRGVTCIVGPSGSGKTSLLRCVAGLERPQTAALTVAGQTWQNQNRWVAPEKRNTGFVFQDANLFSHLTGAGNLHFAEVRARKRRAVFSRENLVEMLGIGHVMKRFPRQMSGGEQQRVAIARALLSAPQILLFDEPLASLDAPRRRQLLPVIRELSQQGDIPTLYVSHNEAEVAFLADHVVVMDNGRVKTQGSVQSVFSQTKFAGLWQSELSTVLEGVIGETDTDDRLTKCVFTHGELWVPMLGEMATDATSVRVRVLARDVSLALSCHSDTSILNRVMVEVVAIRNTDEWSSVVECRFGADRLFAQLTHRSLRDLNITSGDRVWAQIKSAALLSY